MTARTRRTASQWQELIEQQIESGLTATEFCRQQELSINYFCKLKRAFQKSSNPEHPLNSFIKLQAKSPLKPLTKSGLMIQYQDSQLYISTDMDPSWIAQLMKALS